MEIKNRTYNLFGTKYKVQLADKIVDPDHEINNPLGLTIWDTNKVIIRTKDYNGKDLSNEEIALTYLHEIVHTIFMAGQYKHCCEDEPLVEWTARCILSLLKQNVL